MSAERLQRPLVITDDPVLREELDRLCAAAGLIPDFVATPAEGRGRWAEAACVVVDDDAAGSMQTSDLRWRSGVVVVTGSASVQSWQRAVALRAEAVVELPADRPQLATMLADAAEVGTERGRVVGVIGTRGGVGASIFAAKLGLAAAGRGHTPVLVDADPGSGGMDMLLGCESTPGLRWPDVSAVNGRVSSVALRSALPSSRGLAVLSWSVGEAARMPPGGGVAMVAAARRGSELIVVDLPRHLDDTTHDLLSEIDVVLLVSGCDVRSASAAVRMVEELRPRCRDLRLVIRDNGSEGVDARRLAEVVGLAVEGSTRHTRRSQRSIDDGLGPVIGRRERTSLERLVARLLAAPR